MANVQTSYQMGIVEFTLNIMGVNTNCCLTEDGSCLTWLVIHGHNSSSPIISEENKHWLLTFMMILS